MKHKHMKKIYLITLASLWGIAAIAQTEEKKEYYPDGKLKLEYTIKNGVKEGVEKMYREDSTTLYRESQYKEGLRVGKSITYSSNGAKSTETDYFADKQHGVEKRYNDDGSLWRERNYTNGTQEGLETTYMRDNSGRIEYTRNYVNGEEVNKTVYEYYDSGKIKIECNYKDDLMDGKATMWYESGKVEAEYNHKAGKEEGLQKALYENGKIRREYIVKDGYLEGKCIAFYEDGTKSLEGNLSAGAGTIIKYYHGELSGEFTINEAKDINDVYDKSSAISRADGIQAMYDVYANYIQNPNKYSLNNLIAMKKNVVAANWEGPLTADIFAKIDAEIKKHPEWVDETFEFEYK